MTTRIVSPPERVEAPPYRRVPDQEMARLFGALQEKLALRELATLRRGEQ